MLRNIHHSCKSLGKYVHRIQHDYRLPFSTLNGSRDVSKKIALLIDGECANSEHTVKYLAEAGRFGDIITKKLYADFMAPQMVDWKQKIDAFALDPVHRSFGPSSDSALIIDAMDILYSGKVDGFCIVSSDSRFARLAIRIRKADLLVVGIGQPQTPEAFVNACNGFVYVKDGVARAEVKAKRNANSISTRSIWGLCDQAFELAADKATGYALASRLCTALKSLDSSLDYLALGYSSVGAFCESLRPEYVPFMGGVGNKSLWIKRAEIDTASIDPSLDQDTTISKEVLSTAVDTSIPVGEEDHAASSVVEEHGDFFYGASTSVPFMDGVRDESLLNNGPEMESETIIQETATSAATAAAESFAAASRDPSLENSAELSSSEGQEATSASKMPDNQDDSSASSNASGDSVMTGLVYRALQNTKHMMAIGGSALSETMKTLDPSFDHRKFGFAKFREFCKALRPKYVILSHDPSGIFLQRKKSYLLEKNVKGLANNKPEYMALVDRAFETCNYGRYVEVKDLLKAITALDPLFDYRALGFPTFHDYCRALHPLEDNLIFIGSNAFMHCGATYFSTTVDYKEGGNAASNATVNSILRSSPYSGLVYRALQNIYLMMAIDASVLPNALRTLDPSFDYRKFGFATFREFCNALQPEYVFLSDVSRCTFMQRKKSYLLERNVKGLANNKPKYMALVDRAFDTCNNRRFVEVGDLLKVITALDPLFDYRALGFPTLHDFSRALQPPHKNKLIVIDDRIFVKAQHILRMLSEAQVPKEMSRGHATVQPFVASSESADSSCDLPSFEEKGQSV